MEKQLLQATEMYFLLRVEIMIWDNSQQEPIGIFLFTFDQEWTLVSPENQASGVIGARPVRKAGS
jgi:hypothetical protein